VTYFLAVVLGAVAGVFSGLFGVEWFTARYKKCLPYGRNTGQRYEEYLDVSTFINSRGWPPLAETAEIGEL